MIIYPIREDYAFLITQKARENNFEIKNLSEEEKEKLWRETTRICSDSKRDGPLIEYLSGADFKREINSSNTFAYALNISFKETERHYGTMKAAAAKILRIRNPDLFNNKTGR